MTAPANRWKLGLFVLAGCGLVLAGFTWLGVHELKRATHIAWAYFDEALTGLEEGSPVRFRGVRIGVVDRIDVGEDRKHLAVQMSLYDDYLGDLGLRLDQTLGGEPLQTTLRAQVVMSWVTGTAFVQVDFFPDPPAGPQQLPFVARPNTLRTVPSTAKSLEAAGREVLRELPAMASAARELLSQLQRDLQAARLPELAGRMDRILATAVQLLGDVQRQGTVAAVSEAIAAVRDAATSVRAEDGALAATLREVRGLVTDARRELVAVEAGATAAALRRAADGTAGFASSFGGVGKDLQTELAHLHETLTAVQRLADLLERDPGSLLRGRAAPVSPLEGSKR